MDKVFFVVSCTVVHDEQCAWILMRLALRGRWDTSSWEETTEAGGFYPLQFSAVCTYYRGQLRGFISLQYEDEPGLVRY